ncbi:MAG: TIGR00269 family protein [Candidatus Aenigmatarchaeota archaeon]|nr:MAG: TIGR00269 family protein [Candidatus Aenigmarchaeota archaeon]
MKCSCGRNAVIFRRYEGRPLCATCFSQQLEKKVKGDIRRAKLLEKNDIIAVGLSGGKDSSLTTHFLSEIAEKRKDLEVFAIGIDEGIKGYRDESLKFARKLCKKRGINFYVFSFKEEYGKTLDQILSEKKGMECTYCGVLRRELLNRKARELGATKLTVGHNMDDELQSLFMNYLKGDFMRLVRLGIKPVLLKNQRFIPRIKPLRNVPEKEVALYCILNGIEFHNGECPYAGDGIRFDVRDFLNEMEERYPGIKYTALRAFDSILPILRKHFSGSKLRECKKCGEPTSRDICKRCELLTTL